jgi:hypothetical protein
MGGPIHDHTERKVPPQHSAGDPHLIHTLSGHVEKHLGPIESVAHDLLSDVVHVDLLWVAPGAPGPFHTIVTCGMSERAMHPPDWANGCRHAELMLRLPPEWRLDPVGLADERHHWPLRELGQLARMPHLYETWLWAGHTVANCDPPEPLTSSTGFAGSIVVPADWTPPEFNTLQVDAGRTVHFFSALPLYPDELLLARQRGTECLLEMLDEAGVSDLLDPTRPNLAPAAVH